MGRLAVRSANKGIDEPINNLPVLEPTGSRHALPSKATPFKHSHRSRVPLKHWRLKANKTKVRHDKWNDEPYRFSHDATAPVRFAQPIPELGGLDVSTFSQRDANAACRVTVNLDCPMGGFGHGLKKREPPVGIGLLIRVRESVCEVAPNIGCSRTEPARLCRFAPNREPHTWRTLSSPTHHFLRTANVPSNRRAPANPCKARRWRTRPR